MTRLRRLAASTALLAALPLMTVATATSASASCTGPALRLAPAERSVEPGGRLTVRGVFFIDGCDDTPSPDGEPTAQSPGSTDVPLRIRQGGRVYELGRADAGGPDGAYGRIRWDVDIPVGLKPGYARLKAPLTDPMIVAVESTPAGAYAAVASSIRNRDVDAFRQLRAWRGVGAEVNVEGCSYGDQRPRRIVNCLHRAVQEGRLRLPEAPDRVVTLRQLVRSDHPDWSDQRRSREVRGLVREVRGTTDQRVRPRDIASAQVDDAAQPGTPLDVIVVRLANRWSLYWLETRTRVQE